MEGAVTLMFIFLLILLLSLFFSNTLFAATWSLIQ
jgi:hypothetical protein